MPHNRKLAVAVLMAFTLITAPAPDGFAWRQDDAAHAAVFAPTHS